MRDDQTIMPPVKLAALSARALRRELDASRARGDAKLAYEILQEMAARRDGAKRGRKVKPPVLTLEADETLATREDEDASPTPVWPPPAPEVEPGEPVAPPQPTILAASEDLRLDPAPVPPRRVAARKGSRLGLGFILGLLIGVGAGVAMAPVVQPHLQKLIKTPDLVAAETPPAPVQPAIEPAAPSPPPVVAPEPEAAAVPEPPAEPAPPPVAEPALDALPRCDAEPTPADRAICRDPELQGLQQDLRQAYADALEAHDDRDLLRARQLAWRDARNGVSDPQALARLYRQRIERLNAATAAARAERP